MWYDIEGRNKCNKLIKQAARTFLFLISLLMKKIFKENNKFRETALQACIHL